MSITFSAAANHGTYYATADDSPELNMANANAARLLALLGFTHEDDYYGGVVDAQDFLGRILIAQAMLDVATDDAHGRPTVEDTGSGGMVWIECGVEPGYLAERLAILQDIATWAQGRSLRVAWV
jgi:hypothetical protein